MQISETMIRLYQRAMGIQPPKKELQLVQLTNDSATVSVPITRCRLCDHCVWEMKLNYKTHQDEGGNICARAGRSIQDSYAKPPTWCPKHGVEIVDKVKFYGEFLFRARMMAFAEFDCLTSCLVYIATDEESPMVYRECAFKALKEGET